MSFGLSLKVQEPQDFPGSPVIKTVLPMPGAQDRSLVRKLRSHMLHGAANK